MTEANSLILRLREGAAYTHLPAQSLTQSLAARHRSASAWDGGRLQRQEQKNLQRQQ